MQAKLRPLGERGKAGIQEQLSNNNNISGNILMINYDGIYVDRSNNNIFSNNQLIGNNQSFYETASSGNTYEDNAWLPSGQIPFGDFYLIFSVLGIIATIMIARKRIIVKR